MVEDSREDIGRFQGLDRRRNGTEPMSTNLMVKWDKTAENLMLNFAESGHPIFRATSALERGELKSKGNGVISIHFNGSDDTTELIDSSNNYFRQSAHCLRSSCGLLWRICQRLTRYGETRCE